MRSRRRLALTLLLIVPILMGEKCFEGAPTEPEQVPDAPTIGTATAGNTSAEVTFTAPTNTGTQPITSYVVSCSATGGSTVTASGSASPITVTGLSNGISYSCSVVAMSAAGSSAASASVGVTPSTVPGAPTIGAVTPANGGAVVNFTAPSSNGGAAVTGYTATCTPTGGAGVSATGTTSPITVNGLTNGTQYGCTVIATNARGNSAASASANVTPANTPGAPTGVSATPGNGQATINFTAPASNGGAAITSYTATCTATGQTTRVVNGSSSPLTVMNLSNGVLYACSVTATNAVGTGSASAGVDVTPVGPPGAPTIGTATPGDQSASIAFAAPASNGGSAIISYSAACTPAGSITAVTVNGPASPINVTGLTNGTGHTCNVKATNAIGTGTASGSVSVTPRTVPGAPTNLAATPGNATASFTFTAPASNGGSTIVTYTVTCTAAGETTRQGSAAASPVSVGSLTNAVQYSCSVTATNAAGAGAASASVNVTPVAPLSTSSVMCPYAYSQQNTVALLQSTVSWTCNTSRSMTSTQIPDYPAAKTYTGNPNSMSVQNDPAVTFTLTPELSGSIYSSNVHIIGWAKNGVKFDPATAETCPTQPYCSNGGATYGAGTSWNVEAIGQTLFSAGVDKANAHMQPNGAYHYHGMPNKYLSWLSSSGTDTSVTPTVKHYLIGFALDGFPIYAKYGYGTALDATSAVREILSSYQTKASPDAGRPSTSIIAMGTFTQDWQYVAGSGDLDECNGRFAKTPEFPNGIYHYYITNGYPYIQRCFKGKYP